MAISASAKAPELKQQQGETDAEAGGKGTQTAFQQVLKRDRWQRIAVSIGRREDHGGMRCGIGGVGR
jgi:hypothetical protein